MKNKKILLLILCLPVLLLLPYIAQCQGIEITSGASITTTSATGNASILITNGGLINNGTFTSTSETVTLAGTTANTLTGSSATSINTLTISNTGGITTQLDNLSTTNLNILTGSKFTIDPLKNVTVNTALSNNSGSAAGLLLRSTSAGTASLLHNSGNVPGTIQRFVTGSSLLTAMMYHMVSVPLVTSNASTSNLFYGSYLFDFTESTNTWNALGAATNTVLDESRGYMTYAPFDAGATYVFAGEMNSNIGGVTSFQALTTSGSPFDNTRGWNLVPNPYPSAIDWNASEGWTKTNLDGSIYFWPAGASASSGNYCVWNGTSGTGTPLGSRYIPLGQSFFVHANAASPELKMDNRIRVHNNQALYKNSENIANLLRIQCDANNAFDELIVNFREDASEFFDPSYDAYKLLGGSDAPQFSSSISEGLNLTINTLPFSTSEVIVPLNFKFNSAVNVTFVASGMESFAEGTPIFLEDIALNKMIDLRQNSVYSFSYLPANSVNRFRLHFSGITKLDENNASAEGTAYYYKENLYLDIPDMDGEKVIVSLFTMLGQQLTEDIIFVKGLTQLPIKKLSDGVYIIRAQSGRKIFTTKVICK